MDSQELDGSERYDGISVWVYAKLEEHQEQKSEKLPQRARRRALRRLQKEQRLTQ